MIDYISVDTCYHCIIFTLSNYNHLLYSLLRFLPHLGKSAGCGVMPPLVPAPDNTWVVALGFRESGNVTNLQGVQHRSCVWIPMASTNSCVSVFLKLDFGMFHTISPREHMFDRNNYTS